MTVPPQGPPPPADPDLVADARRVLTAVRYLVLATVDADGAPHASPVFFTQAGRDLYWVSNPRAHHSRNVATEPRVDAVVFDSTRAIGAGEAVYVTGRARQVPDDELAERCAAAYADPRGLSPFTPAELSGESDLRLYVLTVDEWFLHAPGSHPTRGGGTDRRLYVDLP
ncbi:MULTISPECIES: pyridoxamine 5'-phosphate oxidase family protein [unclassified Isoptericola]|uniref:pyridoxamine 5'-phosphate oxidase family protein n=1 Tax=unclassified Isoptericola TaxID=2623355 RepID=UPI003654EEEA